MAREDTAGPEFEKKVKQWSYLLAHIILLLTGLLRTL